MDLSVHEVLASITTVPDTVRACGYRRSIALTGRESKRTRPGLYQCSNGTCRFQFTITIRTPLHATKLPLRVWLSGLWLMLQSDKRISSIRLAEALGISQQHCCGNLDRVQQTLSNGWLGQ